MASEWLSSGPGGVTGFGTSKDDLPSPTTDQKLREASFSRIPSSWLIVTLVAMPALYTIVGRGRPQGLGKVTLDHQDRVEAFLLSSV